jgi:hypothetical protein
VAHLLQLAGAEVALMHNGGRLPAGAAPVLVARSTASGLGAAGEMLAVWHPEVVAPWLVVVADVPAPPPSAVHYRVRVLSSQVRGVVTVPYLWALRATDRVADVGGSRAVRRAAQDLAVALSAVRA